MLKARESLFFKGMDLGMYTKMQQMASHPQVYEQDKLGLKDYYKKKKKRGHKVGGLERCSTGVSERKEELSMIKTHCVKSSNN